MNNITSPRTDDQGIEALIQAKGKVAARVTPAMVEANIVEEHYFTAAEGVYGDRVPNRVGFEYRNGAYTTKYTNESDQALSLLTFCVLVLANGFTVTGESACASPENFDAEIGKKIARANAVQKIWPLMGYELRTTLSGAY